eukprot:PhM_4_TR8286/c1_g1_i1/m.92644
MDTLLLPKLYVGDHYNCRLVELDLNTQTSSIYVGTNSFSDKLTDFNNIVRTSAKMAQIEDAAFTSDYIVPAHLTSWHPKVSRTTDIVTLLHHSSAYGCYTNAHVNGIIYCTWAGAMTISSYTVPGGVVVATLTGGAFAPHDSGMRLSIDAEMKVLWISAQVTVFKYDLTTDTATIIAGLGRSTDTGAGPMASASFGFVYSPCQAVRVGELLIIAAGWLARLRFGTEKTRSQSETITFSSTLRTSHTVATLTLSSTDSPLITPSAYTDTRTNTPTSSNTGGATTSVSKTHTPSKLQSETHSHGTVTTTA